MPLYLFRYKQCGSCRFFPPHFFPFLVFVFNFFGPSSSERSFLTFLNILVSKSVGITIFSSSIQFICSNNLICLSCRVGFIFEFSLKWSSLFWLAWFFLLFFWGISFLCSLFYFYVFVLVAMFLNNMSGLGWPFSWVFRFLFLEVFLFLPKIHF